MVDEETSKKNNLLHEDIVAKIKKRVKELNVENPLINIEKGSLKGDNYLGTVAKIDINGKTKDGEEIQLHWIAKSAPTNKPFREMIRIEKVYEREAYIYQEVIPVFIKFQEDKNLKKPFRSFAPFKMSYLEQYRECIVMENMKEQGFRLQNRFTPLDLEHVLLVMKEYGRFHALSFALKEQKREIFDNLASNTKDEFFSDHTKKEIIQQNRVTSIQKAIDAMNPITDVEAIEKLENLKPQAFDIMLQNVSSIASGEYGVIGHGDSWMNNLLFNYKSQSNPNKPTDILFLDWQLARVGSPCLDICYFLFTCTDKKLRDMHYEKILNEYYQSLSSFLTELGSDPKVLFPKKVFGEHMNKFCMYGFFMALTVIVLMQSESEEAPDWSNMSEEELTNSLDFNPTYLEETNRRLRDVVLDYVERGYF